jgi:hypothetical protein
VSARHKPSGIEGFSDFLIKIGIFINRERAKMKWLSPALG